MKKNHLNIREIPAPLVLLIEDNEDHAELVRRGFEMNHPAARLLHMLDGEAALTYLLKGQEDKPDLTLLDLRIPRVDGLEVLRQMRHNAELQDLPIVVLSSSEAENDISQVRELGANAYLVKPFRFDKLNSLLINDEFFNTDSFILLR